MKLIVMIPAYNEQETIGKVIQEIPREIVGVDEVRILVLDDGSTDDTARKARDAGADWVISNMHNLGLARTFKIGLEEALKKGADIIVNTDADFQYNQREIPKLIAPIVDNSAHMVIGNRQIRKLDHMPWGNKYGNLFGSFILRLLTGSHIRDASSGFRAFSRECALRLNLRSIHTYTHETIIQTVNLDLPITEIPIEFRRRMAGESKLIRSLFSHIKESAKTILRTVVTYKPFKTFLLLGGVPIAIGILIGIRFLYFYFFVGGQGHIQSLILMAVLVIVGFIIVMMGVVADLIATNRKTNEELLYLLKKEKYDKNH